MEFWGIEVKPSEKVCVDPGLKRYLHISQAALGTCKKDKANDVELHLVIDDKNLIIGTLSLEKFPQISLDLAFEKAFELSHNGKSSVYFCGYKTSEQEAEDSLDEYTDSEEEMRLAPNGRIETKEVKPKPDPNKVNAAKVQKEMVKGEDKNKFVTPKDEEEEDEDDSDEGESLSEPESTGDGSQDMIEGDDSDEDDSSEEEKETTPKAEIGKKRAAESGAKGSAPDKKAKLITPSSQKSVMDQKKGVHTATPYPKQKVGKSPSDTQLPSQRGPKADAMFPCRSCNRKFTSEVALGSHTKAKHVPK